MKEAQQPFYFLFNTLKILSVDDDKEILDLTHQIIGQCKIYTLLSTPTLMQAEENLLSGNRFHCCICDFGIEEQSKDQFYLLKKFGKRIPFVMFTGRNSVKLGFDAHKYGAKAIIEKSTKYSMHEFIRTINLYALRHLILPSFDPEGQDSLNQSTTILFSKSPQYVSQWASELGLTDRALRYIWSKNIGANAKIILSIFQMYSLAFQYYEQYLADPAKFALQKVDQTAQYKRLEEFFHIHKSIIMDFISYGNIVIS